MKLEVNNMKKILSIFLVTFIVASGFAQTSVCGQYHKKYCKFEDDKGNAWMYNAQSKSGLFNQGMVSKLRCVIYKGMDYRISGIEKRFIYTSLKSSVGIIVVCKNLYLLL